MLRVTNKIMTNSTLSNINKNKIDLMDLEEKYQTGKKIQRPSDDPVIAVRALKFRNNITKVAQYYRKNVPDARNWITLTEKALDNITSVCKDLVELSDHGANDVLSTEERMSIMKVIAQYREQVYQEGNADCAGRYVFTGYKTDTSYTYLKNENKKRYTIKEELDAKSLKTQIKTSGGFSLKEYDAGNIDNFSENPQNNEINFIRLSYKNLDKSNDDFPKLTYLPADADPDSEPEEIEIISEDDNGEKFTSTNPKAYEKPESGVRFIADTGELILSDEAYETLKTSKSFNVEYNKTNFVKGDVRPEHYFDCDTVELDAENNPIDGSEIHYTKEDQDIEYELSFNQRLQINTQAKDSIDLGLGRELDGILSSIEAVNIVENKIEDVKKRIRSTTDSEEIKKLNLLKTNMETELTLKNKVMQDRFAKAIDSIKKSQDIVDKSLADLGSRDARLELTKTRLTDQESDFKELMSNNENADIVETIVNFNAQEVVYNASLAAASKVIQNTLLDFLR